MIVLQIAKNAREWRDAVLDRDGFRCVSLDHASGCPHVPRNSEDLQSHHIVYRAHLSERSLWIVENGICLSAQCHSLAHRSHNFSIGLKRANEAVAAVNCLEAYPIARFTRKKIA